MVAPTILVAAGSFDGNFGDTIDIGVDVIHPVSVASVAFPAATMVMTLAQHGEAIRDASLRATIRTIEAIETVTHNHERLARIEIKRQLASVQESHRQDREDFKNLKEFMTSQFEYRSLMSCSMIYVLACIGGL
ncbi:hypothetical protein Tco_1569750 [Tanacetum coccineum]